MYKVPGMYWPTAAGLNVSLKQEPLRLNPKPASSDLARLKMLYSDKIGGILLVTTPHPSEAEDTIAIPYITIMAAPSLIPLGPFLNTDPPGIDYA